MSISDRWEVIVVTLDLLHPHHCVVFDVLRYVLQRREVVDDLVDCLSQRHQVLS